MGSYPRINGHCEWDDTHKESGCLGTWQENPTGFTKQQCKDAGHPTKCWEKSVYSTYTNVSQTRECTKSRPWIRIVRRSVIPNAEEFMMQVVNPVYINYELKGCTIIEAWGGDLYTAKEREEKGKLRHSNCIKYTANLFQNLGIRLRKAPLMRGELQANIGSW